MPEIDWVIYPAITLTKEGVFELDKFYQFMRDWFNRKNYDLGEQDHIEGARSEGLKDSKIGWTSERKVDEYIKFFIDVSIKCQGIKKVKVKNKTMYSGKITVGVKSYFKVDWDDRWQKPFFVKFMKETWDKLVMRDRYVQYNYELKEQTYEFFNQAKSFLNLQQF